jgi:shikimate kinase
LNKNPVFKEYLYEMKQYNPQKIFLLGMPGSGKSTLGKKLAIVLNLPFFDLDQLIEDAASLKIPILFENLGETGFRKLEKDILSTFIETHDHPFVMATGGGTVINDQSLSLINQTGVSIYLQCNVGTLMHRLGIAGNPRPLLQQKKLEVIIPTLLQNRESQYLKAHIIQPADGSIDEIISELVFKL